MTQIDSVSPAEIVAAFGASKQFPAGSLLFKTFAPYIGHLAEIVGDEHFTDLVNVINLSDVASRYLSWLVDNEELEDALGDVVMMHFVAYAAGAEMMAEEPVKVLFQLGLTEAEFIEQGLNTRATEMYRNGELTLAKLLATSPELFVPQLLTLS